MVEDFEGKEEYLEVDALFNGEPVERVENGGDVFWVWVRWRAAEFWTSWSWRLVGVAVVEVGGDEGMDEGLGSRGREAVSDFGNAAKVEVGGLDNGADMGIKGEGGVQDNAEIACQGGGSDGRGVDGE